MIIVIILLLVAIIVGLMVYNMSIHKKVDAFKNIDQQITSLNVLQDFMNTVSETSSADEKLQRINDILIEKYKIKYSTIVVYNGADYEIKASNVMEKHWETLKNLQSEPVFRDSIETATPKYITVNSENEKLPYQKMEFGRAKSAMFFPLYIDNVYIGYWIIEGSTPHEFDNTDTTILEVVKNNIISVLKTVENQSIVEKIVRDDEYSELKTAEYLYTEGKKVIDKYDTSTVCLFKITNLVTINETVSRKTGDKTINQICNIIKQNLAPEYLFVRYMGPKFAIVFSGVDVESVTTFVTDMKNGAEEIEISLPLNKEDEEIEIEAIDRKKKKKKEEEPQIVKAKLNFVLTTYYKGTGMEEVLKKLEQYVDNADKKENDITCI